ncbi:MAG: TylF/MycF/NovP-related O-methyltransferase [Hyphomicrobiaceae bacterium]
MSAMLRSVKSVMRQTGVAAPLKKWLMANMVEGSFHTLSPDLLVALTRAFELQTKFEGRAYYEFGLYQGFSIWFAEQIARGKVPADFPFYGFDSFEGLPPSEVDSHQYNPGELSADYENVRNNLTKFGADWGRLKLFKGFYSDALFATLAKTERFPTAAIAVIDVDIYESCVIVLDFLKSRIEAGTILVFDDYNDMGASDEHGERKALREFMAKTGMELEHLFDQGRECAVFRVNKAPV